MSHHHQLAPLADRLSPEQLRARTAKTEVRQLISLEHAKTRGYVNLALQSTQVLHRQIRQLGWACVFALIVVLSAISYLWFRG